jgi:ATP/maltotriose-dependent transcriptional regulator MalT
MTTEQMIEQLNTSKVPIIVLNKELEKFRGQNLFPEKLKRANEILAKTGLPKLKFLD